MYTVLLYSPPCVVIVPPLYCFIKEASKDDIWLEFHSFSISFCQMSAVSVMDLSPQMKRLYLN